MGILYYKHTSYKNWYLMMEHNSSTVLIYSVSPSHQTTHTNTLQLYQTKACPCQKGESLCNICQHKQLHSIDNNLERNKTMTGSNNSSATCLHLPLPGSPCWGRSLAGNVPFHPVGGHSSTPLGMTAQEWVIDSNGSLNHEHPLWGFRMF